MKKKLSSAKLLAIVVGTLSSPFCASTISMGADSPFASKSSSSQATQNGGWLMVYSDTEQQPDGDGFRYIHTSYKIQTADGKFTKWINFQGEMPDKVTLPGGHYIILAQSEQYGWIKIPVVIKTGRTASLHLERKKDWDQDLSSVRKSDLIHLPNGNAVGVYE